MRTKLTINRRALLGALAVSPIVLAAGSGRAAESLPRMTVTMDPSCGCCGAWIEHVQAAGFPVDVVQSSQVYQLKTRVGVPAELASCHTAQVGGYVIEGHVPAEAIKLLLADRPVASGLAVPGMPVGSPGMQVQGVAPDRYEVVLFGAFGQRTFASYRGSRRI